MANNGTTYKASPTGYYNFIQLSPLFTPTLTPTLIYCIGAQSIYDKTPANYTDPVSLIRAAPHHCAQRTPPL